MIYDPLYETGDCQHSLYLGCRHCDHCVVEEYNKEVMEERQKAHKREQEIAKKLYGDI